MKLAIAFAKESIAKQSEFFAQLLNRFLLLPNRLDQLVIERSQVLQVVLFFSIRHGLVIATDIFLISVGSV